MKLKTISTMYSLAALGHNHSQNIKQDKINYCQISLKMPEC